MRNVATVMAPREAFRLEDSHVKAISEALAGLGAKNIDTAWLAENEAIDFFHDGDILNDHKILGAAGLADQPIDCVVQKAGDRQKKLMLADMDSTIIRQECIDEIADVLGLKDKVAAITEAAMRGELDFKASLRERVALLEGVTRDQLQGVMDTRIDFSDGAETLVKTLKKVGTRTAIVSGGFTFFVTQVQSALGFDHALANLLLCHDDKVTGRLDDDIVDADGKREFLLDLCDVMQITSNDVIAIGDGANDIPMMTEAGLSLSYCGKPAAEEAATGRLRHVSLEGALFVLGVPRFRFAA